MKFSSLFSAVFGMSTRALLALSVTCCITSCDDDPEPDKISPELTITGLADNSTVWDVVSISLEASDDRGLDKVEIFVDGSLVKSFTEAPFSAGWDTNTLADGSHTVTIVATDKAGNIVEKKLSVTVKNILVSFKVPEDHLRNEEGGTTRGFLFLSDADGKLIRSVEFDNGESVEIKAPDFKGETFTLTQVRLSILPLRNEADLWTFPQVERGAWTLFSEMPRESKTPVGQARLDCWWGDAGVDYAFYSSGENNAPEYSTLLVGNAATATITLAETPTNLYTTGFPDNGSDSPAPVYHVFKNIVVGNNVMDLDLVNKPLTKLTATTPAGFNYVNIQLLGTLTANDFSNPFVLDNVSKGDPSATTMDYYKPGAPFASYFAAIYIEQPGYQLRRGSRNVDQLSFAEPQHQGTLGFSDGKVTSSLTGGFDLVSTAFSDESQEAQWTFFMPPGADVTVTVPEVPEALKDFNVPVVAASPGFYMIHDYVDIENYNGFKGFMRNATYGIEELDVTGKEYTMLRKRITPAAGRIGKN